MLLCVQMAALWLIEGVFLKTRLSSRTRNCKLLVVCNLALKHILLLKHHIKIGKD